MEKESNHAIVYGASGLIGWALVDQLLNAYPQAGSFSKVTAVTNRPLNAPDSHWPEPGDSHQPDLQLISNIDLRRGDGSLLANSLMQVVNDVESVTHVYYLGESCPYMVQCAHAYCYIKVFTAMDDDIEEVAVNKRMFQNVIDAHGLISPNLQFVVFPGGTRVSKYRLQGTEENEAILKQSGLRYLCPRRHLHPSPARGHGEQPPG